MILKHSRIFSLIIILLSAQLSWADYSATSASVLGSTESTGYYYSINGKSGSTLREALTTLLYTQHRTYSSYNWAFENIDTDESGNLLDIYSTYSYNIKSASHSYSSCGTGINREHLVPQSLFKEVSPQVGDKHHLYLVDGKTNGHRSSYAFGECSAGEKWCDKELGRLGASTFSGYSGWKSSYKVFEPDDEYKGDIARAYMYMVVRYATSSQCSNGYPVTDWSKGTVQSSGDGGATLMFSGSLSTNYGLSDYAVALLMAWHRADPVSAKEIARNNRVEMQQGNRNPFVDYPCLAEYLWGNKAGETVTLSSLVGTFTGSWTTGDGCPCGTDPAITLPAGDVYVGATESGTSIKKTITVQGVNLTSGLSFAISGTNSSYFSLSANSMTQTNATNGSNLTITYLPTSAGNHTATLAISGGGLASNYTITLSGTCCSPYTVTLSRNGITETIGACGTYTLPVAEDEADACDGWEFKGWITSSSYNNTTAPTYTTSVSGAQTVYAVYGHSETSGGGGASTAASVTFNTAASDGGTDFSSSISTDNIISSASGISSYSGTKVYAGKNGAKLGSSSAAGSITLTLSSTVSVTKVTVSGAQYGSDNGTLTVTAGSTSLGSNDPGTNVEYTASSAVSTNTITIATSKRAYISSITVTTGSGSTTTTYKTTPCTTYTISYADANGEAANGSYWADQTSATEGTIISLEASADEGYELTGWTVTKVGGGTVTVSNDEFTMPANNVTVAATFAALSSHTVTFMNNGATYASRSGYTGSAISAVPDPTACEGYTFEGWSTQTYAADNTGAVDIDYTGTIPAANTTYHAVYSKTESGGSGSSSTSNITASASLVSGITTSGYTFATDKNGGSSNPTYSDTGGDVRLYAKNQITISASSSITQIVFNVSTQGKKRLAPITASDGTIATQNSGDETVTWTGSATSITFTVGDNANYGSEGSSKAGQLCFTSVDITSGSGSSTTYHTTSPNCCTATLTVQSPDDTMGTVTIE